jgi:nicotinate-nucleotide pyrophosphorylase (carboxylating)
MGITDLAPADEQELRELVARALAEDIGSGDVTSEATVPADTRARASIVQREAGVIYGVAVAVAAFRALDPQLVVERSGDEGAWHESGSTVLAVRGNARALLAAERTALNFLGRLSGIATLSARAVEAVAGTGARVLDTRKTTPGLRTLEKQAVAAGGASNHRRGLFDAVLIKENHIALAGGVTAAVRAARSHAPGLTLEVEVRDEAEIDEALAAGAERLLLDNMDLEQLRSAVSRVAGRAQLEASGGVTLETLRAVAATGVDFVSMGSLTHSAAALDVSLSLEPLR